MKQSKKEFNRLKDVKRNWDASITDVLTRALETNPLARFTSCTEFEGALARAFAETPHRKIDKPVLSRCPACAAPMVNAVKHLSNAKRQRAVLANRARRSLALRVIDENPR
jgi:hypothetical protein